ncbi:MAG: tetratricopeptide repeat protein [Bacteroidales bacterium]|nr:tetratricopeptide repeat protein [Bacteroidales bacterium]
MKTSVTFNKLIVLLLIASAGILAVGCSNKKNSFTRRVYNNLTAHYNTWWNGNEALEEGFTHIETKTPDNYTTILPVFPAFTKKEASAVNPKAERAIEKGSKVIQRNSMFFNKKELNRWIDDSYFMIGKAYYLKQDYRSARRTFEFILTKYKDSPLIWQVTLWLAHTNNAMEQFSKAGNDLERFRIEMMRVQMPRKDLVFFHKVYAEFFLKQNNLPFALPHVLSAMELSHKKIEKNRLRFIAAQIYQSQNQLAEATKLYQSVVNHTPGYEMEFNSRINIAKCYDASAGSSEKIVKALEKMLDDAKNADYHDQIYYALSEVNFKDRDTTSGIKNLRLSVATSKVNDFQKAQSALQLAEIFFQKPDYQLSKAYYDTTLQATSKESPRYEQLSIKTKVLTQLVDNLVIIQNEDSLQKVASMSESDRNALIDSIIAKIVEEERKKAEEERNRQTSSMMSGSFGREQQTVGGGWYFYNPQALSMGFTEFTRKWGNRRLEDLWRLSNKEITLEDMADNELPADTSALPSDSTGVQADGGKGGKGGKGGSTDPKNRDFYIAKLPLTPEALVKSDQKIMEALFKAAFIYREGLADLQSSRATFEELVTRYSDTAINKNYLLSCFMISDLSKKLGDDSKAAEYAGLIIKGYPSSDYALILKDPSFVEEMAKNNQEASLFYEETYGAYKTGQYYTVLLNNELAHQKFGNKHELMPRFDYLKALAIGNLEIVDSLAVNLQRLVKTYPRDPIASEAMKILDKIARMNPSLAAATGIQKLPDTPEPVAMTSKYKMNEKATHSCLVVVKTDSVDVNVLKIRISDFNSKSYSSTNLSISGLLLDNTWQIVNITGFKDMLSAMDYYDALMQNQYVLAPIGTTNHFVFAMSSENYPIFYQSKDLEEYETFFRTNYIKSQTSGK